MSEAHPERSRPRGRLAPEDWLLAGQDLLRRGGFAAVKLAALTEAAGATTGSFYHHFADMDAYLRQLAEYYGGAQVEATMHLVEHADPTERLAHLARLFDERNMAPLDRAMRIWAAFRPEASAAVQRTDRAILAFLERAFVDLGIDAPGARLRARMLLSTAVADIGVGWDRADGDGRDVLDLLLRRAGSPPDGG